VPFVGFEGRMGDLEDEGGGLVKPRGPVRGAPARSRSGADFGGGLRDLVPLDDRGGVRVRVRVGAWSLREEAERLRGRSGRRDGGSSTFRFNEGLSDRIAYDK